MSTPAPSSSPDREPLERDAIRVLGYKAGLAAVGFTHASPFTEARVTIERHRDAGFDGGMQFTYRNPERSTTPTRILESAQSVIVGALQYPAVDATMSTAAASHRSGRPTAQVAAFAWHDHYSTLRSSLGVIAEHLAARGYAARVVADDNALVDRAAAVRAGLGWTGRNSMVLVPGAGSWVVLGSVVTDAVFSSDDPVADRCGTCTRCIDACPTGAIVDDGVVDARRCLAWLVQAEGDFPQEFRAALGTRIYGCDECQEVCPPSLPTATTSDKTMASLDLADLLNLSDEALIEVVGAWYIPRRDPRYVRRNALVALGNSEPGTHLNEVARVIARYALGSDPLLAEHARWAADRLGLTV